MLHAAVLLVALCASSAEIPEPIAYWPMEGIASGAVQDVGPNGLDATVRGTAPEDFVRTGLFGNAAFFDIGRNFLEVAPDPRLDLTNNFTISCAILPFSVDGFCTILWKGDRTRTPQAVNYYLDLRDGKVELKAKDAEGRWVVHSTAPCVIPDAWHTIRVSYANGAVRIWVNGESRAVNTGEDGRLGTSLIANDGPFFIGAGANARGVAYGFFGLIDDLRIMSGASGAPTDAERDAWSTALAEYPRRLMAARIARGREHIHSARATHDDSAADRALLDRLDAACEGALTAEVADAEDTLAQVEQELDRLAFRRFYGRHAGADAPFMAVPMRACERLVKTPRFFERIAHVDAEVRLESARNEYEGFQVALIPAPGRALEDLTVAVSKLSGPGGQVLANGSVEWGWVRAIATERPDIPVDFVGLVPDAIIENEPPPMVGPYDFEMLHIRVFTPSDAAPGDYQGTVTIEADGHGVPVAVRVRVHRFALPDRTPLRMAFSFFEHFYRDWYGLDEVSPKRQRALYEFLLRYRIPPNNIYSHLETYPSLTHLETLGKRCTFFTFSTGEPYPGVATAEDLAKSVDRIETVYRGLVDAGLTRDAYFYCFDEISYHREHIPAARRLAAALRDRIPDIRIMQTSFPDEEIRDIFNVWCPIIHYFEMPGNRRILEDLREEGNEIWWYLADMPKHPFPNLFLDYPLFDARILGVLSFLYDVEGVLYWCINREWRNNVDAEPRWPEGEWKAHIYHFHTGMRKRKNGMGNLIYPGPDGRLYPSVRLENLRDGIEDHAYLTLLEEAAAAGARPARAVLEIPANVATAANAYNPDPQALLDYRRRIAEALDAATP